MTSLDRARRFLASKTAKLALAAVPLALAVPAAFGQLQTPLTFNTDGTCMVSGSIFASSCGVSSQALGGNTDANEVSLFGTGESNSGLEFFYSGSAMGTALQDEVIPLDWNFSVSPFSVPAQSLFVGNVQAGADLSLVFTVTTSGSGSVSATENFGFVGTGTTESGSDSLKISSGSTLLGYSIDLIASSGAGTYQISIPGATTLDLNGAVSATPEPSSADLAGLGLAGVGLFGLFRRFRRHKA